MKRSAFLLIILFLCGFSQGIASATDNPQSTDSIVIHELGHTFGLIHCHVPSCVMISSTYVEDIDQKSSGFCLKCRKELNTAFS